jgi:hypothetical protein
LSHDGLLLSSGGALGESLREHPQPCLYYIRFAGVKIFPGFLQIF